jgi:uncharacterized protein YunC (DUF1805 family)
MSIWEEIRQLAGCELHTAERNKTFTIDAVGSNSLVVVTEDGNPHPIKRTSMEKAVEIFRADSAVTRAQLQEALPGNRTTSYMLAICLRLEDSATMPQNQPRTTSRELQFENGTAIGISNRWERGQYCSILTRAGIVGCGIYDLKTAAEFGQAVAIAKGTPARPLVEPEDLFEAKIVAATPQAEALGVRPGMTGREAVELMLQAERAPA